MRTKQPTKDKILDAVFELVYINGYNGTSMSMILKKCNLPKGSLYHHFKSKKEMVISVVKERIGPRMDKFYELKQLEGEHGIDTIINSIEKVTQLEELILYGCPLNRLNQEMSPVDLDFENEINCIYDKIKLKIVAILSKSQLNSQISIDSLAEFIIATVWGSISLSPNQSSKKRYTQTIEHLINYLKTLKK